MQELSHLSVIGKDRDEYVLRDSTVIRKIIWEPDRVWFVPIGKRGEQQIRVFFETFWREVERVVHVDRVICRVRINIDGLWIWIAAHVIDRFLESYHS